MKPQFAKENMRWWTGIYKKETDEYYYTYNQAIETAKEQWLTLPTKQDFLDMWFTEERSKENKELADKLWLKMTGFCDSSRNMGDNGECGYLGSVSEYSKDCARFFRFYKGKGDIIWNYKSNRFVCRPLVKKSKSTIWQFDYLLERAKENNISVKTFEELKVLLCNK